MKQAPILIIPTESNPLGVIGEVVGENGELIQGTQLVDIISQVSKFPNATSFLVTCSGPGGDVDAGNQIHDYLEGLKAEGKIVNTTTAGDIGSILTKIFLVGQDRSIREEDKFYVHSPWVPHMEGNAGQIIQGLEHLIEDEQKLRDFYKQKTGITEAGLKGLMDGSASQDGTFMSAEQAVGLKFATRKISSKIKAYAQLQINIAKENQTIGQKVDELKETITAFISGKPAALDPAAALPPPGPGEEPGEPAQDPNVLPDGEIPLADGRVLVIKAGQIVEIKMPAAAVDPTTPVVPAVPAAAPSAAEIALQEKVTALEQASAAHATELANAAKALDDFKNTLVSGKAPAKAFNNNGNNGTTAVATRTITQVMAQKQADRKKQLNKN